MAGTVRFICVAAITLLLIGQLITNVAITGTNLLGGDSSSISVSLAGVSVFPTSGQFWRRAFIYRHGLEDETIFNRAHYESSFHWKDEVVFANTRPSSIFLLQDKLIQYTISRYNNRKKKKIRIASSRYNLIKSKRFRSWRKRRKVYQEHRFRLKFLRACSFCVIGVILLSCHVVLFFF